MAQDREEHHHHDEPDIDPYKGAAGGWDSLRGMAEVWADDAPIPARVISELARQNKPWNPRCSRRLGPDQRGST